MTTTIYPPLAFNELGQRDNNEDSVSPAVGTANSTSRVFVVCDGVGGGVNGEVASRIVADGMVEYFAKLTGPSTDETVAMALRSVEQALDAYLLNEPDAAGMATTLTLLHLHDQGATVAHVGDSRVYCCREGRVAFQTDDHKLVNEWVANGILTPEQAEDHPQRNVITRAVRGSAKPAQADVALLTGLRADDYFFLCTDGVLENLTTEQLCAILATTNSDEEKLAAIRHCCDGQTSDNYSAYFIHIQSVSNDNHNTTSGDQSVAEIPPASSPLIPVADSTPSPIRKPEPVMASSQPVQQAVPVASSVRAVVVGAISQLPFDKWTPYVLVGLVVVGLAAWYFVGHRKPLSSPEPQWSQLPTPPKPQVVIPPHHLPHKPNRPHKLKPLS